MDMRSLITLGIALIFIGMLAAVIGSLFSTDKNTKLAVGGFIGFIPFGFANDKNMQYFVLALSAFILVLFIILGKFFR